MTKYPATLHGSEKINLLIAGIYFANKVYLVYNIRSTQIYRLSGEKELDEISEDSHLSVQIKSVACGELSSTIKTAKNLPCKLFNVV